MVLSFLSSLGPAVGNHLWQSTVFVAVVWVVALVLRRNAARVRYGLWLAASVKFLVPFSLLIGLGGLLPRPTRVVVAAPVYSAVDSVGLPFSEIDMPVNAVAETHVSDARHGAPDFVAVVWVCGVLTVLVVWLVRWRRVAAAMRRAVWVESGREFEILRGIDTKALVGLRMSRELMEPGVFGVWRPVLLWPEQLSLRLQDEHIAAIVAHELMHVRRRDNLAAMLHMVVEAAFWFHPMVWWMERRMVEERERACDEAVVEMGAAAGVYAESLLKAVRFCVESPLSCVAGISGADLSRRVRSIMTLRLERLSFSRRILLTLIGILVVVGPVVFGMVRTIPVYGQVLRATGPRLSFEVATIKPSKPDENEGQEMGLRDGRYHATHVSLRNLVKYAYQVKMDDQLVGGPNWVDKEFFDVEAKMGESDLESMKKLSVSGKVDQFALGLQSLLEDRFQLKVVDETRELPAYALVVAKGGPKLKKVSVSPEVAAAIKPPPPPPPPPPGSSSARPGSVGPFPGIRKTGANQVTATASRMTWLADWLLYQGEVGNRAVVDQTGLTGNYDFVLNGISDAPSAPSGGTPATPDDSTVSIFTALQEQLGLKLVPIKAPTEVLVIDHAERPVPQDQAGLIGPRYSPMPLASAIVPLPKAGLRPVAFVQGSAAPLPSFEVASVKPVGPNSGPSVGLYTYPGGRIICSRCPVQYLLMEAFNVQAFQVSGPDWIKDAAFDVEAKPPASSALTKLNDPSIKTPPNHEQREMLQSLLMERFQLKFHRGTKEGDVYVLEKGDRVLKLKAPKDDHAFSWAGGVEGGGVYDGAGMAGTNISMAQLAMRLSGFLHRPVLDQTGISGSYDFEFRTGNSDADADVTAAIFTSMQGIGLRVKTAKGPVETIVVDHVERPTAN